MAHDDLGCKEGDLVQLAPCQKRSKRKSHIVTEILRRAAHVVIQARYASRPVDQTSPAAPLVIIEPSSHPPMVPTTHCCTDRPAPEADE
eukprot:CAMPEP_0119416226 /NCGR_PEP_ID=MMETSP1335-20130426/12140_1 /TAXON_ID=259385 /ORGANISM="Chrysoculter rhomboideus, Strain RCC1486" /LENGTH=88 /DNA_ID=CAMNT_0007441335 /DNA_START=114 /DNA_END=379 /DNA_ORIENTATION=+